MKRSSYWRRFPNKGSLQLRLARFWLAHACITYATRTVTNTPGEKYIFFTETTTPWAFRLHHLNHSCGTEGALGKNWLGERQQITWLLTYQHSYFLLGKLRLHIPPLTFADRIIRPYRTTSFNNKFETGLQIWEKAAVAYFNAWRYWYNHETPQSGLPAPWPTSEPETFLV